MFILVLHLLKLIYLTNQLMENQSMLSSLKNGKSKELAKMQMMYFGPWVKFTVLKISLTLLQKNSKDVQVIHNPFKTLLMKLMIDQSLCHHNLLINSLLNYNKIQQLTKMKLKMETMAKNIILQTKRNFQLFHF